MRHNYPWLVGGLLLLLISHFLYYSSWLNQAPTRVIQTFEKVLHQKEQKMDLLLGELAPQLTIELWEEFSKPDSRWPELYDTDGFLVLQYQADTLVFWSGNSVPVDRVQNRSSFHSPLVRLPDGWYEVRKRREGPILWVGLILLKKVYPYQNNYLVNSFQAGFSLSPDAVVALSSIDRLNVKTREGNDLCSIRFPDNDKNLRGRRLVLLLVDLIGLLLLLIYLHETFARIANRWGKNMTLIAHVGVVLGIRALSISLELPVSFYELGMFGPEAYGASEWFPSLGDLSLNMLVFFYLAYLLNTRLELPVLKASSRFQDARLWLVAITSAGLFSLSLVCDSLVEGLIIDSNISFNVNNLFALEGYSYQGIFVIGVMLFAYFLLFDKVLSLFGTLSLPVTSESFMIGVGYLLFLGIAVSIYPVSWALITWPLLVASILAVIRDRGKSYSFGSVILLLTVFSLYAASALTRYSSEKEHRERILKAEKLSEDEDPIAELLYQEMEQRLMNDLTVRDYFSQLDSFDQSGFEKRLEQQYFNGYFSKYNLQAYVFKPNGQLAIGAAADKRKSNPRYFENLIGNYGRDNQGNRFYYIDNFKEQENYILKLKFPGIDSLAGTTYLVLESKLIPEKIGFPDLLLDKKNQVYLDLTGYSIAKYKSQELRYEYGSISFPLTTREFGAMGPYQEYLSQDENDHLVYRIAKDLMVVVSKPEEDLLARATTFSYLFAFFSLIVLLLILLRSVRKNNHLTRFSFHSKVQFLLVTVILASLILFGLGTSYYINRQYKEKNFKNISEKIQSVLIEVDNKLGGLSNLKQATPGYKYAILTKFSNVFFTDITLYSPQGTLLATSRPKLFNEGLLGRTMNAEAFYEMHQRQKSEFIHEESIGKLSYLSAYVPFYNKQGKLMAYLNLPYFAKQSELENEISSFLVALINIYVLLFALSVVVALLISNIITQPLRLLQNMLSQVELGKTNEAIAYDGRDEIGSLVTVYNRKVAELESSAEKLAQSERESAWREMAKQVAHEIKNPLTPMKLSVQHLLRAWQERPEEFDGRLKRVSTTLIEQIDTLSSIASEFSNFAKMPRAKSEVLTIDQVLQSVIDLYTDLPRIELHFKNVSGDSPPVFADKDHLLRVFNNLIKNAIQAIPEDRNGKIEVLLTHRHSDVLIEVKDNGTGIPDELVDRIFVPNFTTKTAGMGLGLAMVRNMITNAGGLVWFETKKGEGTSFYVTLPVYSGD
ncbi:MAG: PAS domain-containing sensor histidine kinase [Salibacteraceae bacterium]